MKFLPVWCLTVVECENHLAYESNFEDSRHFILCALLSLIKAIARLESKFCQPEDAHLVSSCSLDNG
ncbi:hypothetical protein M404DRAFT_1007915 [Pisolithus tinctorius Marx 270]|uniref:Uncharacterized protein n=1 Tax=Pisolithus tinctorius Marx 270 TaxID=870435 RepID=A0A0C3NGS4_PISTI|nr:hypothetical protein M404DRAFT_1007915 [Pisolithus tinctorius Marx 270]